MKFNKLAVDCTRGTMLRHFLVLSVFYSGNKNSGIVAFGFLVKIFSYETKNDLQIYTKNILTSSVYF